MIIPRKIISWRKAFVFFSVVSWEKSREVIIIEKKSIFFDRIAVLANNHFHSTNKKKTLLAPLFRQGNNVDIIGIFWEEKME